MLACIDTHYFDTYSQTAVLLFEDWEDEFPSDSHVVERTLATAEYIPGQFYLRELPCILEAIAPLMDRISALVVDGFVQLGPERPGLGQKLYEAIDEKIIVIGVAKNEFVGADAAIPLLRGESQKPLYITSAGIPVSDAVGCIEKMHGPFRIPTLLKQVDQLARGNA